jgi:hypothetical protein
LAHTRITPTVAYPGNVKGPEARTPARLRLF